MSLLLVFVVKQLFHAEFKCRFCCTVALWYCFGALQKGRVS